MDCHGMKYADSASGELIEFVQDGLKFFASTKIKIFDLFVGKFDDMF